MSYIVKESIAVGGHAIVIERKTIVGCKKEDAYDFIEQQLKTHGFYSEDIDKCKVHFYFRPNVVCAYLHDTDADKNVSVPLMTCYYTITNDYKFSYKNRLNELDCCNHDEILPLLVDVLEEVDLSECSVEQLLKLLGYGTKAIAQYLGLIIDTPTFKKVV